MRKLLFLPFLCILAFGCKKEIDSQEDKFVDVIAVNIRPYPNEAWLNPGQSLQLGWYVNPSNGLVNEAEWGVYSESVATVTQDGLVTAVGIGDTRVWIRVQPSNHIAHFQLHVVQTPVPLGSLNISPSAKNIKVGGTCGFDLEFTPSNTTQRNLAWSSSDEDVATVAADGTVTGRTAGTATITVKELTSGKQASAQVNVVQAFTSISQPNLSGSDPARIETGMFKVKPVIAVPVGGKYNIECIGSPSSATDHFLYSIESGMQEYASVTSSGQLTALKANTTPVAVTVSSSVDDAVKMTFYIHIYPKPTGVAIQGRFTQCIGTGKTQTWILCPEPSDAYPYLSYSATNRSESLISIISTGDGLSVTAAKLSDDNVSRAGSSTKNVTATVRASYGNVSSDIQFKITKYDYTDVKPGDGLVVHDSKLASCDGGNRGLGITEEPAFTTYDVFAIIGYYGNAVWDDCKDELLKYSGKLRKPLGIYKKKVAANKYANLPSSEAPGHGIALPFNVSDVHRTAYLNNWGTEYTWKNGEAFMQNNKSIGSSSDLPSAISAQITKTQASEIYHTAYINTCAICCYNYNSGSWADHVRPAIYVHSALILSENGYKNTHKYKDYYFGTADNASRLYRVGTGVSATGYYTTPWLLPTAKDLRTIFYQEDDFDEPTVVNDYTAAAAKLFTESVKHFTQESVSYYNTYWTSTEYSSSEAWYVKLSSSSFEAGHQSKSTESKILPVLYF